MYKTVLPVFLFIIFCVYPASTVSANAVLPGTLDIADGTTIAGWAQDPDYNGSIDVHIYVDGVFVESKPANKYRADVGARAFHWIHHPFGAGTHTVQVFAINVNSQGQPVGSGNVELPGSPKTFNVGCSGLTGDARVWCDGHGAAYWGKRQQDTMLLFSRNVKLGINNAYGGFITQFYNRNKDVERNLIDEHGGSAMQLSLYGYDLSSGNQGAWFGVRGSGCYATRYTSYAACMGTGLYDTCRERGAAYGSHVADCQTVFVCNAPFVDAGWPYNPIQAQATNCQADNTSNNVYSSGSIGDNGWQIEHRNPVNYSKSTAFLNSIFYQTVELKPHYASTTYRIVYNGTLTLDSHGQEIPALFASNGINKYFSYYDGTAPYTNTESSVRQLDMGSLSGDLPQIALGRNTMASQSLVGRATERWWSVCDIANTNCITVAIFDPFIYSAAAKQESNGGSYIAPMSRFAIRPGLNLQFTVYMFPFRYNEIVEGKSVRAHIFDLQRQYLSQNVPLLLRRYGENNCNVQYDADQNCRINSLDFLNML